MWLSGWRRAGFHWSLQEREPHVLDPIIMEPHIPSGSWSPCLLKLQREPSLGWSGMAGTKTAYKQLWLKSVERKNTKSSAVVIHREKEEIKKEPNQEDVSVPVILVQTAFWPKKINTMWGWAMVPMGTVWWLWLSSQPESRNSSFYPINKSSQWKKSENEIIKE